MKQIREEEFEQLMKDNDKPVLVDFFATWCGPCRAMHPILENVEKTPAGEKFTFVQVDVDTAPGLSARFGVMAVPTIAIFKDGQLVYKQAGVHQPAQLKSVLEQFA